MKAVFEGIKPIVEKSKELLQLFFKSCFVPSIFCYVFVELCSRQSIGGLLLYFIRDPFVFFYNVFLIAATASVCLLFRRRIFVCSVVLFLWAAIGVTDMVLLSFRTTPFTAVDLLLVQSALRIMNRYLTPFQMVLIGIAVVAVLALCVYLWKYSKKEEGKIQYLLRVPFCAALLGSCLLLTQLGLATKLLDRNFGNLANAFHENGLPYCFMNSLLNTGVAKPEDYSPEQITVIIEGIGLENGEVTQLPSGELSVKIDPEPEETVKEAEEPDTSGEGVPETDSDGEKVLAAKDNPYPNILFLQLESFFDPKLVENSSYTEDPVPYFTYLKENFSSGFLSVPSVGAGTANTEFELITGMNLDFFGPGEYPYKTILKSRTCESVAYNLKELGFSASAIHNNDGTFYGRNEVFSNLGFDRFDSIEYMQKVELTPLDWAKDKILVGEIMSIMKLTEEKDYIYTISVQGHGAYPEEPVLDHPKIDVKLPEELSEKYYPFLYYVNQLHEMDEFLRELVLSLAAYPEDVVLVLYGDHLPGIGLTEELLKNGSLYQTEYVIWSNFAMEPEEKDMEAYQLPAYVLGRLGIDNGIMTKYHQSEQGKETYLENMEVLIYDMLYGDMEVYHGVNPYEPTELFMGIGPVFITDVFLKQSVTEEGQTIAYVQGEGFTEWSTIAIDSEPVETIFLNENLLATTEVPDGAFAVTVRQQGSDEIVLSETAPFMME
ncbi:MAG: LTA synthase family protein [Lachnospiraceae bacterium]